MASKSNVVVDGNHATARGTASRNRGNGKVTGPSLYERLGGPRAIFAAVEEFYVRVLDDPQLAPFF